MKVASTTAILILLLKLVSAAAEFKVACYFGSWTVYRQGKGKFRFEDIDPHLCTHVLYAFVGINVDGSIRILDEWNDIQNNGFNKFNALKKINPNLKTLLAIGGWNEGSVKFSKVAASASARKVLINNAVSLLDTYGFDGFDLDWEYPGQREGAPEDKENFSVLLKEFREVFNKHGYLLTAAVAAAGTSVDISYEVPVLSKYLDFINVMTYDLHGSWEKYTGQNAPLYPHSKDVTEAAKQLNVVACIQAWIKRGAAPEKLILGMGTYGRSFTLADPNNNGVYAPSTGAGSPGPYTSQAGMLGYNEICEKLQTGQWNVKWCDEQLVPYAHLGNQWVGYDNQESVALKVAYAKATGLGGAMIWSIETDDFRGECGPKYPILSAINAGKNGNSTTPRPPTSSSTPSVPATSGTTPGGITPERTTSGKTTTSTTVKTTTSHSGSNECRQPGYYRDPVICSRFYYCQPHGTDYIRCTFNCAAELSYDDVRGICDWKWNVDC